ncbi:helix-turn-helix domain-containing protein [Fusobacterium necrophorum]|uniref:HTH domain-containing protein n=1 Tax=Fusobacterium necrophorum TaxID=859 RepID=UPI00164E2171|nr:HTH domain-containing protein [Fusobacterium necrophorum]
MIEISKEKKEDLEIIEKLKKLNIKGEKVRNLIDIYKKGEELTAESLAKYMYISARTASRILEKLEKENLAIFSIEKINRGRPRKIYSLKF